MSLALSEFSTTNYMVPSNGQTHCVAYKGTASATPFLIDWRQFALDAQSFQPQGVFIDNTQGTVPLVLTVNPIGYVITVPAGGSTERQFPAPNGQTMTVTGDPANPVALYFVDFPVLPSGLSASISNTVSTQITGVSNGVVFETDSPALAAGNSVPYRTQEYTAPGDYKAVTITGAAVTGVLTPTLANENLRKLLLSITGNASLAAAGLLTITATANGVQFFKKAIYLPVAAPVAPAPLALDETINFEVVGIPLAASNITITLSAALATGQLDANAYFTAQ